VQAFRRAVAITPEDPEALENLGNALLRLADEVRDRKPVAAEAEQVFRHVVRLVPAQARGYVGLARALIKKDPKDDSVAAQARAAYTRALQFDPDNFDANLGAATLFYDLWTKSGDTQGEGYRRALACFRKAAELRPPEKWDAGARSAYEEIRSR
jgi:cytochrome c-type biogenesis protein CcmH/NrfG